MAASTAARYIESRTSIAARFAEAMAVQLPQRCGSQQKHKRKNLSGERKTPIPLG